MTPSLSQERFHDSPGRPTTSALEEALTRASRDQRWGRAPIVISDRQPLIYESFFPTEVVTCSDADERAFRILCKYGDARVEDVDLHRAHGHRRGVAYEAMVYQEVLSAGRASTPAFLGAHRGEGGATWLFTEYLDGATRLTELAGDQGVSLDRAAEWLGRFHSVWAEAVPRTSGALVQYTRQYMSGWVDRTVAFAGPLAAHHTWIADLQKALGDWAVDMSSGPQTLIHGEFYPQNILVSDGAVVPIDWESTALGPAEIDLAALTEGWPPDAVDECISRYRAAHHERVGSDLPSSLERARLYWDLRWLGDRPEWTLHDSLLPRLERVRRRAVELGYLR
jgi:thiamine kinase-like enzyme